jgi:hypothetical protein
MRRQLAELDAHMRQDVGLEPFDTYYGWRGHERRDQGRLIA